VLKRSLIYAAAARHARIFFDNPKILANFLQQPGMSPIGGDRSGGWLVVLLYIRNLDAPHSM